MSLGLVAALQPVAQAQGPSPGPALLPTVAAEPPKPDQRSVMLSSGSFHTCALRANGEVVCWGAGPPDEGTEHGQVDFGQASPPAGERFSAISSGANHSCGLREDGSVVCWGPEPRPGPFGGWEAPPEAQFASIDGAHGYTCGLPLEGPPTCWGSYSETPNLARYPPSDQWFMAISGGGGHTCGFQKDGIAVCWEDLAVLTTEV